MLANQKFNLVVFDLDDTLIYEIDSVLLPCIIYNKYNEAIEIDRKELTGSIHWIEADYLKAALLKGLSIGLLKENLIRLIKPIKNIKETIKKLHENNIKCILITAGPIQVAKIVSEVWEIDYCFGSTYEEKNGFFTGRIIKHLGIEGKLECLLNFCNTHKYEPSECVAVGDGDTDIPIFNYCGNSIALNCSDEIINKAKHHVVTDDLLNILKYIV